jgi:hypothetical protein
VLFGVVWCCLVLFGVVWCCLVLFGVVLFGVVLFGVVLFGVVWVDREVRYLFSHGFVRDLKGVRNSTIYKCSNHLFFLYCTPLPLKPFVP